MAESRTIRTEVDWAARDTTALVIINPHGQVIAINERYWYACE